MATNTDTAILVADGTNFNPVVPSGDITLTNAGVFGIANGVIINADIKSDAGISISKTALVAGTNCTLSTDTLNVDDAFLINSGDDTTTGTITAAGYKLNKVDDAGDVTIQFQQGGTTTYTMGIDDSVSGNVFKIHSGIALADTSDFTIDASGNATIGGDLTITGDDLFMATNTDTAILVADGTNFNPVVPSGDITLTNVGVFGIASGVIINADIKSDAGISISKTALVAGTNCTLSTDTLNVDDAFLINSGDDTTTGTITAAGYKLNKVDDAGDVTIQFQQGGTTTYTMGIDDSVSGNVFKIHSGIALADTSDFTIDASGNATIGGDLTITGDDLFMATNTDTAILVADGTNFNPVVPSGDITLTNVGVFGIASGVIINADIKSDAGISISKTALVAGTNCTLSTDTLNVDDAFLINSGDDTTTGTITAAGYKLNKVDDAGDVTIQFQQGGTTTYTMGIDDSVSGNVFKIHSGIALADTSDFTIDASGNATIGGDLTITGDDLFMATNTDTAILVADGTNFNPVVPSGDITLTNVGVFGIASGVIINADIKSDAGISISKTALVAGTNCTLSTDTLNVDDAFLINSGDDTTTGTITAAGYKLNKTDDAGDVTIQFQQGGTTTYTMGIDDSVSGNVFKIHSGIALADTSDFTIDTSGNATIGGNLTVDGHINNTGLVADSTDIVNDTDALAMPWTNTGKTFKCLCTGSAAKVITFAAATSADIGKKIKIIQTATPASDTGDITFVLTTQTLDTSSYILKDVGGTFVVPTMEFATASENTLTFNPAATNCAYGVGTIMTWEVISTSEIRCEVRAIALGNGGTGTISFDTT